MPLDHTDPHWALGFEHGCNDFEPYLWQDMENDRRYRLGYHAGLAQREEYKRGLYNEQSLRNFEQLARQMQRTGPQSWRIKV